METTTETTFDSQCEECNHKWMTYGEWDSGSTRYVRTVSNPIEKYHVYEGTVTCPKCGHIHEVEDTS
jgi:DNA-directed RNA polymerase subunit RPC12/RpoP